MKKEKLFELINSLSCDIEFVYAEKNGSICPLSRNDIDLVYGKLEKNYDSVDKLMSDNVFEGKCLNDIAEKLDVM